MVRTRVAIVGAGITGLALERELRRRGVEAVVLEASGRPGGVVRSLRVEGTVLDVGPQRTRLTPSVARLVEELGLEERVVRAPGDLPLFAYRDGRLRRVPLSVGAFLGTDLLSPGGKLRVLLEPLVAWADGEPRPGETVASWLTRRLGSEAYRFLVGPLYGSLYGSDPGEMPMEHSLSRALQRAGVDGGSLAVAAARWMLAGADAPPPVTFVDGMAELTDALRADAGERVRLSCPVTAVRRRDDGGPSGPAWEVAWEGGAVEADRVVLTCPADAAARILPGEARGAARRLGRLRYNELAVVHLLGDCDLEGHGYVTALPEDDATRGVTWNASLFDRAGVYTAFLGGALRPEATRLPDEELARTARREFGRATGCDARPVSVRRTRMPARDRSWSALEGLGLPRGLVLCGNYLERPGIPGRLEDARATAEGLAAGL